MVISRIVFISILLLINYLLLDFPAAKILIYMFVTVVVVSYLYKRHVEKNFNIDRVTDTYKLFMGIPEPSLLLVTSKSFLPIHALIVTDYADLNVSTRQEYTNLFSILPKGEKGFSYPILGRKRGKYKLGPTLVKFTDFLGLYQFEIEVDTKQDVIVYPNTLKIINTPFKSMQPLGNIKNKVPIFEDQTIITGLRDYQFGDETRKINWKVSAKHNKFMVNTYQPSISAASVIVFNMFEGDYPIRERDTFIESGIIIAASLLRQLFLLRQQFAFCSNCKMDELENVLTTPLGKGEVHYTDILTHLAIMTETKTIPIKSIFESGNINLSWGISYYIITTRLDDYSLYKLIDFKQAGHSITIINIGPEIQKELSLWNIGFQSYYSEIQEGIISLIRI